MKREYEIIEHSSLEDLNVFMVEMTYRSSHIHKEFELLVVLAGAISIYSNHKKKEFHKSDVVILNPRQAHEISALTENVILLSVQVASGFCKKIYPELCNVEFEKNSLDYLSEDTWKVKIHDKLFQLALTYFEKAENYGMFCMAYLYEIFGILLNQLPFHKISEQERNKRYQDGKRLERIMDYIDDHFTEKLLLEDVAAAEHISLSYASHFFKDNLGVSFQDYLTLLRFEKARRLVEQTSMNITDICMECGFSDYRYLNKVYQKQLGCTPMEYRRTNQIHVLKTCVGRSATTQKLLSEPDSAQILHLVMD